MSFSKSKSVSAVIAVATIFFVSCTSKDRYQLPDHKQLARSIIRKMPSGIWIIFHFLSR
jgi:hypothetical protein